MSTDKKKRRKLAAAKVPVVEETPELQAEVRAFASQLGLASGGEGADHAFDDFAPQQAKTKLDKAFKLKSAPIAEEDGDEDGDGQAGSAAPAAAKKRRGAKKAAAAAAEQQAAQPDGGIPPVSAAMTEAIRTREWNEGIGPRPGKRQPQMRDACMICKHHESSIMLSASTRLHQQARDSSLIVWPMHAFRRR